MTDKGMQLHIDCLACQILAGAQAVPGGTIAENPWWVADHCVGPYGLGSVVIKTRTHRENLWDLSMAESASMGPFLQQMSEAIALAMEAERVYVSLWVDQPPYHVHFVLQPRYPDHYNPQELGLKGLELQVFRTLGQPPKEAEMVEAADRIRKVWQQKFAPQASCES
ncbi:MULTISPECIES: diadenosine tetraphosphate hydrolase [Cyanophyceae]|uniref:HIT family protein n=1 Tax=Cyanophyceae TaxID=3028117 RepID=UPI001685BAFB|nr:MULTISPECIES: diadenosine tetraphosphate hydrolase [Cyanophyceae]MBD1914496.1 diadenosine tetraphosphate hydrolase [Phormidium sp. FACHB-77]MBD2031069.1 diadenosine tetraphosphate hydrolase [Phormidium sp. FACHB-322]MBD2052098.1 diadenosine tetraphosphate hydrolase [Leptolyngbya sp. FACHB-60]